MGHKKPLVAARRREVAGMFFKWIYNNLINKKNTKCMCGWNMKPFEKWTEGSQWKCIWKKCGWEAFDNGDGKLHWFKTKK